MFLFTILLSRFYGKAKQNMQTKIRLKLNFSNKVKQMEFKNGNFKKTTRLIYKLKANVIKKLKLK
jgi:hypothetical protein